MNPKEKKDDEAAIEYAEKNGCTVAAARLRLAQSTANKPQLDGGTTELPVETLNELKKPETGKK